MAIVGGSNLILTHEPMVDLSMLRSVSFTGSGYLLLYDFNHFKGFFRRMADVTPTTSEQMGLDVEKEPPALY